jgi:hypothetical protein
MAKPRKKIAIFFMKKIVFLLAKRFWAQKHDFGYW